MGPFSKSVMLVSAIKTGEKSISIIPFLSILNFKIGIREAVCSVLVTNQERTGQSADVIPRRSLRDVLPSESENTAHQLTHKLFVSYLLSWTKKLTNFILCYSILTPLFRMIHRRGMNTFRFFSLILRVKPAI